MGAISRASSIPVLKKYLRDANRSVRETCEIALARIEWDQTEEGQRHRAQRQSVAQLVAFLPFEIIPWLTDTHSLGSMNY